MWRTDDERLALVELWSSGRLRRRATHARLWDWIATLRWTRRTTRRNELQLVDDLRGELEALLAQAWPEWKEGVASLAAAGLALDVHGWKALRDAQRAQRVATVRLPARLNQRTATALVSPHSKSTLTAYRRALLGAIDVTRDGVVRIRPHEGLIATRGNSAIGAEVIVAALGELCITERAMLDGTILMGKRPSAVLLVENPGTYLDMAPPPGWLVAQVPGWNTATVRVFLEQFADVPLVHFGDLDPNGVRIADHVRSLRTDARWFIPAFWEEFERDHAQPKVWPDELAMKGRPPLVKRLAASGLMLEQEPLAMDSRLGAALEELLNR
jgi:hypothetical protein